MDFRLPHIREGAFGFFHVELERGAKKEKIRCVVFLCVVCLCAGESSGKLGRELESNQRGTKSS